MLCYKDYSMRPLNHSVLMKKGVNWFVFPAVVIVFLLIGVGIGFLFYLTFFDLKLGMPWKERTFVGITNYRTVFSRAETFVSLTLSLCYPFAVTVGALLVGLGIALFTVYRGPTTKAVIVGSMIIPATIPAVVSGVVWKLMFSRDFGIINFVLNNLFGVRPNWLGDPSLARFSIIFVDIWRASAFMGLVSLAALETQPKELLEAAALDGANFVQRFRHITIPFIAPVMLTAITLQLVGSLYAFDHIYILTTGGPGYATLLLSLAAYRIGFSMGFLGEGAVYAFLLAMLALVLSILLLRRLKREFTTGL